MKIVSNDITITVQNSDSGIVMAELHMAQSQFEKCCFSPNGKLIAGVIYKAVYVWDITDSNPHIIETIAGQGSGIACLVFSSCLVLGSFDGLVKFWQISTSSTDPVATDAMPTLLTLAPIISVTLRHMTRGTSTPYMGRCLVFSHGQILGPGGGHMGS